MSTAHNAALSYLLFDRQHYDSMINRLTHEVKANAPQADKIDESALKDYFAVALTKGADFTKINFDNLASMSPDALAQAAQNIPDKLTQESRQNFDKAAQARPPEMRWDNLFNQDKDEIVLKLSSEAQSVDERISAYIQHHNQQAAKLFAQAKAEGKKDAGKIIDHQEMRRDPKDASKLEIINPNKPTNPDGTPRWQPGPRLGKLLEEKLEWALLDDFSLENSRKQQANQGITNKTLDSRELLNRNGIDTLDNYDPDSLRVVITRDPQKVGEMSSGQHWSSCMAEGHVNFHYVPKDIEAGALAA